MTDQLLLFDSDGAERAVDDVDGLLLGTGHVVRRDGGARVSILVDEVWRAEALCAELRLRDLDAAFEVSRDDSDALVVGTRPTERLLPLADRWQPGRRRTAPPRLTSGGLRLWVISGGRRVEDGYLLPVSATDDSRWARSGSALAGIGLTATLVGPRGGGPAYRITSVRRLRRLSALVGARPDGAPDYLWP
ncbi:hypothetical protein [Cumulibacter manganitolerans]|uniref:hypothetical protein n=1 Tax=Cumulibacter manganitolerans TaxID=1884992 RepID=UPI0012948C66|nr:hypothetical protein [Cumulibacter manganitolerans]